ALPQCGRPPTSARSSRRWVVPACPAEHDQALFAIANKAFGVARTKRSPSDKQKDRFQQRGLAGSILATEQVVLRDAEQARHARRISDCLPQLQRGSSRPFVDRDLSGSRAAMTADRGSRNETRSCSEILRASGICRPYTGLD